MTKPLKPQSPFGRFFHRRPLVGIWWDNGKTLVAITQLKNSATHGSDLIDSDLNHADHWNKIAHRFDLTAESEYYSVPRGRVLIRQGSNDGLIYHGRSTSIRRLHLIASRFRLRVWKHHLDAHYAFGPEADELFQEDYP